MIGKGFMDHIYSDIWVYGDLRSERFYGFSLKILSAAVSLALNTSGQAVMVLFEARDKPDPEKSPEASRNVAVSEAQKAAVSHGASRVSIFESRHFSEARADVYAAALAKAVKSRKPLLVIFPSTEFNRELGARTARLLHAGMISDCLNLKLTPEGIGAACPSWGGEILAEIGFTGKPRTGFATVQPHAFQALNVSGKPGTVERIEIGTFKMPQGIRRIASAVEPAEQRKLEDAEIVAVGGAGLGTAESFAMVRQLAATLGAEVGATRPPVLQHWVDGDLLIGQTGKTVRPKLLFSIGTSGAVQYTAGIMESKKIVAVNRDPASQIFQIADIGVVADAKAFLPVFISKLRQRMMRNLADALPDWNSTQETGFGAKMQRLREAHAFSVSSLAEATGQSPEFIEQVEKNEVSPSVSFLLRLASALKVDPGTFLREEEKTRIRNMRAQAYMKRTQSYNYHTLTSGSENDHLRAFLVTIESRQTHKPVAYKHEGEEFVYVIEGHVELKLGGKSQDLKPGESVHFHSDIPHKLKNLSTETTRLLVVLYTI